jgi:hypothetical protein
VVSKETKKGFGEIFANAAKIMTKPQLQMLDFKTIFLVTPSY